MPAQRSMVVTVGANVGPYVGPMNTATAATGRFAAAARTVGPAAMSAQHGVRGFASGLGSLNPRLVGPLGLAAGLVSAAGAAIKWESAWAGVLKTVEGSPDQLDRINTGLRTMSTEIPVAAEELARIAEAAGQLGIQTDSVLGFSRVMADLGVATNMASDDAATALARLANITQMSQDDFDRLGATVVDLGNNLATTESEIVEMGLRLAGAGAQVGMTEAEILGLAGALSSLGIRAQMGGTAFSRVMIEIANEVETGGDKVAQFADVAQMSVDDFTTLFRDDAASAIIAFVEGLGTMEERGSSTLQMLEEMGLTEIRLRDALLRASGAGDLLADAIVRGNDAWDENNALTEEAERRYETTASQWQILKNRVGELARSFGEQLKPAIDGALGSMNDFLAAGGPSADAPANTWTVDDFRRQGAADSLGGAMRGNLGLNVGQWVDQLGVAIGALHELETAAGRDLVSALGDAAAQGDVLAFQTLRSLQAEIDGVGGQAQTLVDGALTRFVGATDDAKFGVDQFWRQLDTAEEKLDDAAAATDTATSSLLSYTTALMEQYDPAFAAIMAHQRLDEVMADEAATALEKAEAILEAAAADDVLSKSLERQDERLYEIMETYGLTADEVDELRQEMFDAKEQADSLAGDYEITWNMDASGAFETISDLRKAVRTVGSKFSDLGVDAFARTERRAAGGPVWPGQPYIVGERGQELFVPAVAGTIVPAGPTAQIVSQKSDAAGRAGDTYNVYAPSTDAKSIVAEQERAARTAEVLAGLG